MWTIVILAVVAYIIKFLYDRGQEIEKVNQQGGMLKKYEIIINRILACDPSMKFFKVTSASVELGVLGLGGTLVFTLTQAFGKLNIDWIMKSPIFGKHNMSWNFPELQSQDLMFERIFHDLSKYQTHTMSLDTSTASSSMDLGLSEDSLKVSTQVEENQIKAEIAKKDLGTLNKEEFEYLTQKAFKEDFYIGSNMLQLYANHFPEEKERLDRVKKKFDEEYYDSDNHFNAVLENIFHDLANNLNTNELLAEDFHQIFEMLPNGKTDINSYRKEQFEYLLQYLMVKGKIEHALNLIPIYLKCYPEEVKRLQNHVDKLEGQID